jgi:hypothetical protein
MNNLANCNRINFIFARSDATRFKSQLFWIYCLSTGKKEYFLEKVQSSLLSSIIPYLFYISFLILDRVIFGTSCNVFLNILAQMRLFEYSQGSRGFISSGEHRRYKELFGISEDQLQRKLTDWEFYGWPGKACCMQLKKPCIHISCASREEQSQEWIDQKFDELLKPSLHYRKFQRTFVSMGTEHQSQEFEEFIFQVLWPLMYQYCMVSHAFSSLQL